MVGFKNGSPATLVAIDSSVNNIPAAYSAAAGSKIALTLGYTHLIAYNKSSTDVIISVSAGAGTYTAAVDNFVVPASNGMIALDGIDISTTVYIRSAGSAISSGLFYLSVF